MCMRGLDKLACFATCNCRIFLADAQQRPFPAFTPSSCRRGWSSTAPPSGLGCRFWSLHRPGAPVCHERPQSSTPWSSPNDEGSRRDGIYWEGQTEHKGITNSPKQGLGLLFVVSDAGVRQLRDLRWEEVTGTSEWPFTHCCTCLQTCEELSHTADPVNYGGGGCDFIFGTITLSEAPLLWPQCRLTYLTSGRLWREAFGTWMV